MLAGEIFFSGFIGIVKLKNNIEVINSRFGFIKFFNPVFKVFYFFQYFFSFSGIVPKTGPR